MEEYSSIPMKLSSRKIPSVPALAPSKAPSGFSVRKPHWLDFSDILLSVVVAVLVLSVTARSLFQWWNGTVVGAALVTELNGRVSHRQEDALSWYDLKKGAYLSWNEHLRAERASAVRVRFNNGAEVDLQADSEAQVLKDRVVLVQGKFRLHSGWEKINAQFGSNNVELNPGTDMYVLKDPVTDREQIVVTKGEANLAAYQRKIQKIREGETFRIKPDELLVKVDPTLDFHASAPHTGETLIIKGNSGEISLKWKGSGNRIEIDRTPGFLSPKIFQTNSDTLTLTSGVGKFFWRLGDRNRVSSPAEFVVLPQIQYHPIEPMPQTYVVSQGDIRFQWEPIANATHYLVQLSHSPDFSDLVISQKFDTTQATLNPIPPGAYYWRVQATYKDYGEWPASEGYPFAVGLKKLQEVSERRKPGIQPKSNGPTP